VFAEFELDADYSGAPTLVHGGVTLALLDEAMSWATIALGGKFAYTGRRRPGSSGRSASGAGTGRGRVAEAMSGGCSPTRWSSTPSGGLRHRARHDVILDLEQASDRWGRRSPATTPTTPAERVTA